MPEGPIPDPNFDALRLHLAQLRAERGWSFDELAARAGIGRATLVTLESGKARATTAGPASQGTLATWWKIATALGVSLEELTRPLYEGTGLDV
ncbi:helix-turn-helix transcriptional regulator [Microbacterium trichothecenolyticum]|uniref:helix-turn-helix transcriptional regulator n=1 Tax=Microbacterium trichothecenolyticum TaxID=69370 RepID=UPI0027D78AD4|nr:helix-turn-helix transcriptional regulator [Microbacterium trichothecenolyticum]